MTRPAYYNEIDADMAAWLRELIRCGHIAPGDVDTRSIEDVHPHDLIPYTQIHLFAGVGVWSYALRRAGWPDDRAVWTGSCPCQPFSTAGKGAGLDDERHLWPAFYHLITQRKPAAIFGEQVAAKNADAWIDLVQTDLEGMGYAFGAVPFPSAGVGAPHIRDRTYWMADTQRHNIGRQAIAADNTGPQGNRPADWFGGCGGAPGGMAQPCEGERGRRADDGALQQHRAAGGWHEITGNAQRDSAVNGRMADAYSRGHGAADTRADQRPVQAANGGYSERQPATGPVNGLWRSADWLACRDGKWRPVRPGSFPLVNGYPARVAILRGAGNAINAEAARVFIEASGLI